MKFVMEHWKIGAMVMAQRLGQDLDSGKNILWMVGGGSNIPITVLIMNQLRGRENNLTIMLTDERFGPVGHADSNWQQLLEAGLETGGAQVLPTLIDGMGLDETAAHQDEQLKKALPAADIIIGQFGIGEDGHIAGILPNSPATDESFHMAVGYQTEKFDRITMTFPAIEQVHAAYCFVYGGDKMTALDSLLNTDTPLAGQPCQILKRLPEAYVYNDQLGSNA